MDDMVLVAVVNTRENLFHEDSSILFCEFTSCNDLIEELTSLADSKIQIIITKDTYSVTM